MKNQNNIHSLSIGLCGPFKDGIEDLADALGPTLFHVPEDPTYISNLPVLYIYL